jgi:hypothetical protein
MIKLAKITYLLILGITFVEFSTLASAEDLSASCTLTDADKQANAELSFDDFDQKGTGPATWRQLDNRNCEAAAIEAAEDYLVHARNLSQGARRNIFFHIAQSLGVAGDYKTAALMVASAKDPSPTPAGAFDWNTYLDGTWAFFKRDKASLAIAQKKLISELGEGNQINGSVLTGLLNCFDRPYGIAYQKECRTPVRD